MSNELATNVYVKDEDAGPRPVDYTDRTTYFYVENATTNGLIFDYVIVGHNGGQGRTQQIWRNVEHGIQGYPIRIDYTTGDGSSDDWFCCFAFGGYIYRSDSHQCLLYADDADGNGHIRINSTSDVVIAPYDSKNCNFNMYLTP